MTSFLHHLKTPIRHTDSQLPRQRQIDVIPLTTQHQHRQIKLAHPYTGIKLHGYQIRNAIGRQTTDLNQCLSPIGFRNIRYKTRKNLLTEHLRVETP